MTPDVTGDPAPLDHSAGPTWGGAYRVGGGGGSTFVPDELLMRVIVVAVALLTLLLVGCQKTQLPISSEHLHPNADPRLGSDVEIPEIIQATPQMPPPHPREERYTIVVFDVPVREVLFTLTRNSRIHTDIHPGVTGKVTLNAVDQSLSNILESLARQVDMVYELKGNQLIIRPDLPYWHTYKVDYLNMKRESSGAMNLSLEKGSDQEVVTSNGADITAKFEMDFWDPIADGIKKIIKVDNSERAKKGNGAPEAPKNGQGRGPVAEEAVKNGTGKDQGADAQQKDGDEGSLVIHKATGVISVSATQGQHRQIQEFLDLIVATAQQQVLIEATVVEIKLNDYYIHGVDWSRVTGGESGTRMGIGETTIGLNGPTVMELIDSGQLTSTFEGGGRMPFLGVGHQFKSGAEKNNVIGVSLRLLDEFGEVTVLSSPKVMTLNNQTAVMKVGDQHLYFETKFEESTTESDTSNTVRTKGKKTLIKKEALEGLIISVTPNVERSGIVSLHVRPVLSQKNGDFTGPDGNNYPLFQVREMDSVLRVGTGQVVVLGGLMKDFSESKRTGLPGLAELPFADRLFSTRERAVSKTEMAIFIRPTIMTPDTLRERQNSIRFSLNQGEPPEYRTGSIPALE
ncbi:MAG: hypothetical protein HQL84_12320 [Magnetococcales bacterium]|nr:hypothetical protein [Magnetococcales bacterium]MBF0150819.1 hypothetical protein [Magnetococcales bacterium]